MSAYSDWKNAVLGANKVVGDGQCVSLIDDTPQSYIEHLFPGVAWTTVLKSVNDAKDLVSAGNPQYLTWIPNDHNNANQVPSQGDIMVFGPTPAPGYTNTFNNPAGHAGACDNASAAGYALLQQNAPNTGSKPNITNYPWKFRPCLGWYHPVGTSVPTPAPAPAPAAHTIFLPPTTGPWHLYNDNGPYTPSAAKGVLVPSEYGGLYYDIVADKGNGVYVINTQMFGQGALYTKGSDVVVK